MTRDERQEIAYKKWFKNKGVGCIEGCTAFGKTRTALKALKILYNKYPNTKCLIVVPTTNLKDQWEENLNNWKLPFEVKVINSAVKIPITVDILVIDELHSAASKTLIEIFNTIKYKYVLGLTATFERLDGRHEILKKYCPIVDTITIQEALINGWISPFKEYQVILSVDDISVYKQYNKEFIKAFEFFNFDWDLVSSMSGKNGYKNRIKYRDQICSKYATIEEKQALYRQITYNAMEFMRAVQKRKGFINNHPKKLEIARKIIEARSNSKIITFSNNIKMAESIGIGKVYTGKDSKKTGRATLKEVTESKEGIVINSVAKLIAGCDIPDLSVAIMLGINSSKLRSTQANGRICRKQEGKQAEIFNLIIEDTVEQNWFSKSHEGKDFITIDEHGLMDVLNGKEPKPYKKKLKDFQFRY